MTLSQIVPSPQLIRQAVGRLNMSAIYKPTAKILVLSGQAVLSDLRTVGAPLYSTPATGNWLARIHKFAAKRNVNVLDSVYVRQTIEVTR